MEFSKLVNWQTHTDGTGLWTTFAKTVAVRRVVLFDNSDDLGDRGELRAYFDFEAWNIDETGLIYTDPRWIGEFRALMKTLGFSPMAVDDITYSEQGMQGRDFVSMDVGEVFMRELEPMYRWTINKTDINAVA